MARSTQHQWYSFARSSLRRIGEQRPTKRLPFSRRLRIEPLEDRRLLALVTVDTLDDTVDFNDGVTSLREAIFATNTVAGADTIEFAAALTAGGPATITLTEGELAITDSLTVNGPGANLLTIDASGNDPTPDVNNGDGSRVFNIDDGNAANVLDVSIRGLALTGGDVGGPVGSLAGNGGAIRSLESLTVTDSVITGNSSSGFQSSGSTFAGGGIYSGYSGGNLTVTASTISNNSAGGDGGGIRIGRGNLLITDSTLSGNVAGVDGGGISSSDPASSFTVIGSTLSGNSAASRGGGIWSRAVAVTGSTISGNSARNGGGISGGTVTVTNSTINGNSAVLGGGGISAGTTVVIGSTISGNSAGSGGGIFRIGNLTVISSTISGNSAMNGSGGGIGGLFYTLIVTDSTISGNSASGSGGGISGFGSVTVTNSTITDNQADSDMNGSGRGGGISGGAVLSHTIVAGNTLGNGSREDLFGTAAFSPTFSLIGDSTGATVNDDGSNLIGTAGSPIDPLLGPPADNGGSTFTHALLAGSPAINAGDLSAVAGVGGVPEFDQRGTPFSRVFGGRIDIGAFEYQAASDLNLVVDTLTDEADGNYALGDLSLREALLLANTYPSNDTIRFAPALSDGTILLSMGELTITDNTSIIGLGANLLTIDASGNDPTPDVNNGDGTRIFNIDNANTANVLIVSISGLTLTGGDVGFDGGGILNGENLSIAASTISGNTAGRRGGAIRSAGTLLVTDSMLGANSAGLDGGGISSYRSNLTVTNSTLSGNSVTRSDFNQGGAIWMERGSLLVTGSTISNNSAFEGGGIWIYGSLTVTGSTISGNSAAIGTRSFHGFGGGIFIHSYGGVTITDSTISGNSAARDGGGVNINSGNVTVTNSTISGNTAARDGGGMKSYGTLSIMNSRIDGNTAVRDGGGIRKTGNGVFSLTNSTVRGNSASEGGGIYNGSAYNPTAGLTAIGSTITGNTAALGAGIFNRGGTLTLDSCAVVTNTATGSGAIFSRGSGVVNVINSTISGNTAGGSAGGLYLFGTGSTTFALRHSTIASNTAGGLGGGVFFAGGVLSLDHTILATNTGVIGADLTGAVGSVATARFSLIGTNAGSTFVESPVGSPDANGNVIGGPIHGPIDPRLMVLADHGGPTLTRALLSTSPAIDAGDTSSVETFPALDQRGTPFARIADGDDAGGARIDIGAYERQTIPELGLVVDTLVDESDGDYSPGDLSIREAIGLANGSVGSDTIAFAAELTAGGPAIIRLEQGELRIVDSVTIGGPGAELLTIDASGNDPTPDSTYYDGVSTNDGDGSRVLNIDDGIGGNLLNVSISGLALTGGDVKGIGGAIDSRENLTLSNSSISGNTASQGAGGIRISGALTVTDSTISSNSAGSIYSNGGGIYSTASLTVTRSVISGNTAGRLGGGIRKFGSGDLTVIDSTINGNSLSAGDSKGGGIDGSGNFTVIGSSISGNSSGSGYFARGGGIYSEGGIVTITGSTISSNAAGGAGGGIWLFGTGNSSQLLLTRSTISNNSGLSGGGVRASFFTVTDSTISGNSAASHGGGILGRGHVSGSTISGNSAVQDGGGIAANVVTVANSIVAGNTLGAGVANDVSGGTVTLTFSLLGVGTGAPIIDNGGNLIGTAAAPIDPLLGPLADNGGPTMTHALLAGSPAIDVGDPAAVAGGFDQRGAPFTRVYGGRIDIGAFEAQPTPAAYYGDYNQDSQVDAIDFVVWRRTMGHSVTPYSGADGSGNGIVDSADHGVWRANFGRTVGNSTASVVVSQPPALPGVSAAESVSVADVQNKPPADFGELSRVEPTAVGVARVSTLIRDSTRQPAALPEVFGAVVARPIELNHAVFSRFRDTPPAARRDDALAAWLLERSSRGFGRSDTTIECGVLRDASTADENEPPLVTDWVFELLGTGDTATLGEV